MKNKTFKGDKWVWLDLEMTGLNEKKCVILQAAMIITDPNLREIASEEVTIWQPEHELAKMEPFVADLHQKNGLTKAVRVSTRSLMQAEIQLMETLTKHVNYKEGILVGNTIYMDRIFLKAHIPAFESYLDYRQIDVSSFKLVCQQWYGEKGKPNKEPSDHTAMSDIRQSISELQYYRDNCFR